MYDIAIQGWQKQGVYFFYKGFTIICFSSFYVNAALLPIYDYWNYHLVLKYLAD
jgi:hypothetical protein